MRADRSAICTSGEPVSVSWVRCVSIVSCLVGHVQGLSLSVTSPGAVGTAASRRRPPVRDRRLDGPHKATARTAAPTAAGLQHRRADRVAPGMARPVWTGTIRFGLVNVPVKAFTAVRDHDMHFHQLDKKAEPGSATRRCPRRPGARSTPRRSRWASRSPTVASNTYAEPGAQKKADVLLLAVIQHVQKLVPLIREIEPEIDERMYEGLVNLIEPLRREPIA